MTFMFFGTFQTASTEGVFPYTYPWGVQFIIIIIMVLSSSSWFLFYNATPEATPNHDAVVKNFGMLEMKLENS